ncbi:MAG: hypothetical protein ABSA53_04355 [Streptosporangiaceae bacterium]
MSAASPNDPFSSSGAHYFAEGAAAELRRRGLLPALASGLRT